MARKRAAMVGAFVGAVIIAISSLALASLGLTGALPLMPTSTPYLGKVAEGLPHVGQPAPDFALRTLDGQDVRLSEQRGKTTLINFWATWCTPCRLEMPVIEAAYRARNEGDLQVLAVNFTQQDSVDTAREFVSELGLSFPVLLDDRGEVFELYRAFGLPVTFFVDGEGIIRAVHSGPLTAEMLASYLQQ